MSTVSVVCCQVEDSVRGSSLVQRSPTEYGVSECDLEKLTIREPKPNRADGPWERGAILIHVSTHFLMCRSFCGVLNFFSLLENNET